MKRIEKLTPEQEALIPVWREQWREVGLDTSRIDPEEAKDAVRGLYASAGIKVPSLILIAQSPLQALLMRGVLISLGKGGQLRDQLWDQLRGQLWDQLGDQLWDQLGGQLRGQLRGQLGGQLGGQLWDQLYETAWFIGGWDSFWLAFYEAGRSVGVVYTKKAQKHLDGYVNYAKRCGVAFLYSDVAIVSDRPEQLHFDEDRRLHCENAPAVKWPDGYTIHAWHGTRLPGEWVENSETIEPTEILRCENVEQRAAGAAMIGWPRMIKHMDRKVIDGDPDSDMGALIELKLDGLEEPGRFLQAKCPRNGVIVEGVPRVSDIDNLPINTALAAQAWRIGDPQSEYEHPSTRT